MDCNELEQTKGPEHNDLLLGYMNENEKISFINYFGGETDTDTDTDTNSDTDTDIEDNQNMNELFDLEINDTLSTALFLLPEFCSIPIDIDTDRDDQHKNEENPQSNIDQCLQILKTIDVNRINIDDSRQNKHEIINKISEMRDILNRLHIRIGSDEGFVTTQYEYSVDPQTIRLMMMVSKQEDDVYIKRMMFYMQLIIT